MNEYIVVDNRGQERHIKASRVTEDPSGRVKFYDESDEIVASFVGTNGFWKIDDSES
jgi:hypothetical protein